MKVTLAKTAGFCMGVKRAIELALQASKNFHQAIYSYGPLIHNKAVLDMLESKEILQIDSVEDISSGILIIRAHGIAPREMDMLERKGITLIDATCPRVKRIHSQIKKYCERGYHILIYGDRDHAEVSGLLGTAGEKGTLITGPEDIQGLPENLSPLVLVSQTTQSRKSFNLIREKLEEKFSDFTSLDTLCSTTDERQDEVRKLAESHDAVVVVGGKNSANTARLVEISSKMGTTTYHVETEEDLPEIFPDSIERIAVTAGASTPNWMIERVVNRLETIKQHVTARSIVTDLMKWLIESNFLIAISSAFLTVTSLYLLSTPFYFTPLFISGFYVFSMHILNHFADREAVAINEPLREEVFRKYQNIFIILGISSGIFASCLSYLLGLWAFIMVLTATGTGAFYGFRIVPRKWVKYFKFHRIKDIPASKDIVVALAWSSITVFVPFLSESRKFRDVTSLIFTWSFVFLLVYIRSVMLDIKDIQGDKLVGKETIPLILGEKKALLIVKIILILETCLILTATSYGVFELPAIFQLTALLPIVLVIRKYNEGKLRRRYRYQALLDSSYLVSGVMAIFSYLQ